MSFLDALLDLLADRGDRLCGCIEDDVSALDVGSHILEFERLQVFLQLRHGQDIIPANIDSTKKRDPSFHLGQLGKVKVGDG